MNTNRLIEIGKELGLSFAHRLQLNVQVEQLQRELEAEMLRITPAEGWPGKNEGERKLAAERAASDNALVGTLRGALAKNGAELAVVMTGIDSLDAERRALEWEIRAQLVIALLGRGDGSDAFDDAADLRELEVMEQNLTEGAPIEIIVENEPDSFDQF